MEEWKDGRMECWKDGRMECWSVGVLECWNTGGNIFNHYRPTKSIGLKKKNVIFPLRDKLILVVW